MVAVVCDQLFSSASKYQEEAADGGNKVGTAPIPEPTRPATSRPVTSGPISKNANACIVGIHAVAPKVTIVLSVQPGTADPSVGDRHVPIGDQCSGSIPRLPVSELLFFHSDRRSRAVAH
jgi:hypothetical protein